MNNAIRGAPCAGPMRFMTFWSVQRRINSPSYEHPSRIVRNRQSSRTLVHFEWTTPLALMIAQLQLLWHIHSLQMSTGKTRSMFLGDAEIDCAALCMLDQSLLNDILLASLHWWRNEEILRASLMIRHEHNGYGHLCTRQYVRTPTQSYHITHYKLRQRKRWERMH